jgi:DNA-binding Lrp family transcriptional regulator
MPIDETDRKIIAVLDRDASLTIKDVARKLGMNESTVRKRITLLKERKVIKYYIQIDTPQIGVKTEAALGVDVDASKILEAGRRFTEIPGVRMVFHTSGEHDFWLVIWTTDRESLSRIVDKVSAVDGVVKVLPSVLVERINRKEDK